MIACSPCQPCHCCRELCKQAQRRPSSSPTWEQQWLPLSITRGKSHPPTAPGLSIRCSHSLDMQWLSRREDGLWHSNTRLQNRHISESEHKHICLEHIGAWSGETLQEGRADGSAVARHTGQGTTAETLTRTLTFTSILPAASGRWAAMNQSPAAGVVTFTKVVFCTALLRVMLML